MQENQRDATGALQVHSAPPTISQIIDFALDAYRRDDGLENGYPEGIYHTLLWSFTRAVKSCFREEANPQDVFFDFVHPEIERRGGWESIFECYWDAEDICMEFVCNWDSVRYNIGESPLENAAAKADAHGLRPARCDRHPGRLRRYARFVSIAGWLQVTMGNRPILLPCEKLAELLDVSPKAISRYRQMATRDGYLLESQKHNRIAGRATEFVFNVKRFSSLQTKAQDGTEDLFGNYA